MHRASTLAGSSDPKRHRGPIPIIGAHGSELRSTRATNAKQTAVAKFRATLTFTDDTSTPPRRTAANEHNLKIR